MNTYVVSDGSRSGTFGVSWHFRIAVGFTAKSRANGSDVLLKDAI